MATKTLISTSLATWADANFVGGVKPVYDDSVVVPASASVHLAGSTLDRYGDGATTGDNSSRAAADNYGLDIDDFLIKLGCQINIGSAAAPLKFLVKGRLKHQGSGAVYLYNIKPNHADFAAYTLPLIQVDSPNGNDAFNLLGTTTVDQVQVVSGGCTHSGPTVTLLLLNPKGTTRTFWSVATGTQCPTTVFMAGGELSVYGGGNSTVYMSGGVLTARLLAGERGPTLYMSNGYFRCNSGESGVSSGMNITMTGGTIDFTPLAGYTGASLPSVGVFKRTRNVSIIGDYALATSGGSEIIIGEDE